MAALAPTGRSGPLAKGCEARNKLCVRNLYSGFVAKRGSIGRSRHSWLGKGKNTRTDPLNGLRVGVNKSLNLNMSLIAIPLLLAAAAPLPKPVALQTHAVVSVQIIVGEEIRFADTSKSPAKPTHRQKRVRKGMHMVEFY